MKFDTAAQTFLNQHATPEAMSAFADGFPVPVLFLNAFPPFDKILFDTCALDEETLAARKKGIKIATHDFYASVEHMIGQSPIHEHYKKFGPHNFTHLANQPFPYCNSPWFVPLLSAAKLRRGYFSELVETRSTTPVERDSVTLIDGQVRTITFPDPPEVSDIPSSNLPSLRLALFPLIILGAPNERQTDALGKRVGLPKKLRTMPTDSHGTLLHDFFHEREHIIHLIPATDPHHLYRYYRELACDLSARRNLRQLPYAMKTTASKALESHRQARHLDLLLGFEGYWFAPALDAIENGRPLPSFYKVAEAVHVIRLALVKKAGFKASIKQRYRGHPYIENWQPFCNHAFRDNAPFGYQMLNKLLNRGAFKKNKLAQTMAHKIVTAASFFAADILNASPIKKNPWKQKTTAPKIR